MQLRACSSWQVSRRLLQMSKVVALSSPVLICKGARETEVSCAGTIREGHTLRELRPGGGSEAFACRKPNEAWLRMEGDRACSA